jgi:hypothetical protein
VLDDVSRVEVAHRKLAALSDGRTIVKKDLMESLGLSRTLIYSRPYKHINDEIDRHNSIRERVEPQSTEVVGVSDSELRRRNAKLARQVGAYAQTIRRLALENIELRSALENAESITRIADRRRRLD